MTTGMGFGPITHDRSIRLVQKKDGLAVELWHEMFEDWSSVGGSARCRIDVDKRVLFRGVADRETARVLTVAWVEKHPDWKSAGGADG